MSIPHHSFHWPQLIVAHHFLRLLLEAAGAVLLLLLAAVVVNGLLTAFTGTEIDNRILGDPVWRI